VFSAYALRKGGPRVDVKLDYKICV
jgi:hypothetical protein